MQSTNLALKDPLISNLYMWSLGHFLIDGQIGLLSLIDFFRVVAYLVLVELWLYVASHCFCTAIPLVCCDRRFLIDTFILIYIYLSEKKKIKDLMKHVVFLIHSFGLG